MATSRMLGLVFSAVIFGALGGCSTAIDSSDTSSTSGDPPAPVEAPNAYPGHGFIVHEWGTDTVVVGSDGSLQRGLHHEEEDLPPFVYDRLTNDNPRGAGLSIEVKMETPVTYFYSDEPLTVNASVGFPKGIFTQWYPSQMHFFPPVAEVGKAGLMDPVLDLDFPFGSQACKDHYSAVSDGLLDWGAVDVLPRDSAPFMEDAPLEKYTWSYARDVAANPVRVLGVPDENEKFLFYRGLGNFDLPVKVEALGQNEVRVRNDWSEPIGRVFAIDVEAGVGDFTVYEDGIAPGATAEVHVPSAYGLGLDDFAEALGEEVTRALEATGLYHDESVAMVKTWKRQWFRTPGIRLLYLMPQSWTDASIPLTIAPAPESMVRVMMIRTEVITPEMEQNDVDYAAMLGSIDGNASAMVHFQALGRFAEPRLRRALSLLGDPAAAQPFLASIATAETRQAAGE